MKGEWPKIVLDISGLVWYDRDNGAIGGQRIDLHCLEDTLVMPRKRKQPLLLVIERLSTGECSLSEPIIDDFTGQRIESHMPARTAQPMTSAELIRQRRIAADLAAQALVHQRVQALTKVMNNLLNPPKHQPFKRRY